MNPLLLLSVFMLFLAPLLRADEPNDQFVRIYNLIQEADALNENGRSDQANQKYLEAELELKTLRKSHPDWNESVVGFRLKYIADKLRPPAPEDPTAPPKRELKSPPDQSAALIELLQEQVRRLTAERELLGAKLKEALTAQPAAVDPRELAGALEKIKSLQKEVEVLKVNLKKAESKPDRPVDPALLEETRQSLADAKRTLGEQTEKVARLTLEKEALQKRLQSLASGGEMQLEQLTGEIGALRARIETLEARKTPYSPEELALLRSPESGLVTSADSVSATAESLIAEAARAFSERRYEEAERKFARALRLDRGNLAVLANLAAAQIEQGRLAEAENNLKKALAGAPRDAFSLSLLGLLKIRQKKFDDALNALSQAAQIDPQNAGVFESLGVVLAEKGLRDPAESAFRRAILLAPDNADAHYNLAVLYAAQQPPALELARWHYQKALEGGHAKDRKFDQMLER